MITAQSDGLTELPYWNKDIYLSIFFKLQCKFEINIICARNWWVSEFIDAHIRPLHNYIICKQLFEGLQKKLYMHVLPSEKLQVDTTTKTKLYTWQGNGSVNRQQENCPEHKCLGWQHFLNVDTIRNSGLKEKKKAKHKHKHIHFFSITSNKAPTSSCQMHVHVHACNSNKKTRNI